MTDAERCLWARLHNKQLAGCKFRRQHSLGPFIVDFVCLDKKLVIEVDGGQHLECSKDEERTQWIEDQGFCVTRFWNHEVLTQIDAVLTTIHKALPPHPGHDETCAAHAGPASPSRGEAVTPCKQATITQKPQAS
jgi:very-short-patch-repair endonuclease